MSEGALTPSVSSNAATTSGSRTFADVITVTWEYSSTAIEVTVKISSSDEEVGFLELTPDQNKQPFSFQLGTVCGKGSITVQFFNTTPSSGAVFGDLSWKINTTPGSYSGAIGNW